MPRRINVGRFALSVALLGMVFTPILTGSFGRFVRQPTVTYDEIVKDNRGEFLRVHGSSPGECPFDLADPIWPRGTKYYLGTYIDADGTFVDGDKVPEICKQAIDNERKTITSYDSHKITLLLRDLMLGFLLPFVLILLGPILIRVYLRWVTTSN
jgi:hypothetical protein